MNKIQKWKYYAAYCSFKETKKSSWLLGGGREGYWALSIDKEFSLSDGLNHMGDLGYELVGIQMTDMLSGGGEVSSWYTPGCFYIFKKPVELQADDV